jgi:threonine/homoserine/homoserine lactone efflux protein
MLLLQLIKGVVIGIVIALPIGPVGVLCVRRTLFEGAAFGIVSGLGAALADAVLAAVAGFGLAAVRAEITAYEDWLGVGGGIFLLYLGIKGLVARGTAEAEPLDGEALAGAFASAFALTIANPVTLLSFAGIFAALGVGRAASYAGIGVLIGGVFAGSMMWWLVISFGIAALRRRIGRGSILAWLGHISGAILAISGAVLLGAAALRLGGINL